MPTKISVNEEEKLVEENATATFPASSAPYFRIGQSNASFPAVELPGKGRFALIGDAKIVREIAEALSQAPLKKPE